MASRPITSYAAEPPAARGKLCSTFSSTAGVWNTLTSIYNDSGSGSQGKCPYIKLSSFRSTVAVKEQRLVPNVFVLTSRLSLKEFPYIKKSFYLPLHTKSCCSSQNVSWLFYYELQLCFRLRQGGQTGCRWIRCMWRLTVQTNLHVCNLSCWALHDICLDSWVTHISLTCGSHVCSHFLSHSVRLKLCLTSLTSTSSLSATL